MEPPQCVARSRPVLRLRNLAHKECLTVSEHGPYVARVSITSEEISTQPSLWRRAAAMATSVREHLPEPGQRVAFVGCGTSLYMARCAAALREGAGNGQSDAFAASEMPAGRRYDAIVAISRSGTTSEIVHILGREQSTRRVVITAVTNGAVADRADDVIDLSFADERSVVQTRFATTALGLLREVFAPSSGDAAADAQLALEMDMPVDPSVVSQWTFLGRGWAAGLAEEAALKFREAAQAWTEAYPALEYRHGPISIASPTSVVWSLGSLDQTLAAEARSAGATVVDLDMDPMASLVVAQRVAVALAESRGLNPDRPRNLSRAVLLATEQSLALS